MLEELKYHLKITWNEEDENLLDLLASGQSAFKRLFGVDIDYEENKDVKSLLFDWCRYARNNSLEYFQDNFINEINTVAFSLAVEKRKGDRK